MLLRAEWEKTSSKVCESTKPMPVCDLGQHRARIDMAFDSHFRLIDYRYVLESSDYQIRRSYVDTVFQSGGLWFRLGFERTGTRWLKGQRLSVEQAQQ